MPPEAAPLMLSDTGKRADATVYAARADGSLFGAKTAAQLAMEDARGSTESAAAAAAAEEGAAEATPCVEALRSCLEAWREDDFELLDGALVRRVLFPLASEWDTEGQAKERPSPHGRSWHAFGLRGVRSGWLRPSDGTYTLADTEGGGAPDGGATVRRPADGSPPSAPAVPRASRLAPRLSRLARHTLVAVGPLTAHGAWLSLVPVPRDAARRRGRARGDLRRSGRRLL